MGELFDPNVSLGPMDCLLIHRLTDYLYSPPLQHYFFEVDMDDLTAFD